jgi:glucose/arabinose dehydrogenase
MLTFGPDGYLWIGMGDGGAANDRFQNGQNPASLLGKMLRIDVTTDLARPYLIPPDNPWVTVDWNGVDVRDEIWAVGLRNPWRFTFDRVTGDLWIADVGQNQWEEVNFTPAANAGGLNYGWPIMEAAHCFSGADCNADGLETPILEYSHAGRCSITGGYVHRGQTHPSLNGVYFYADYCSGEIWAAVPTSEGEWSSDVLLQTDLPITSFGEDESGELYLASDDGTVHRLLVE